MVGRYERMASAVVGTPVESVGHLVREVRNRFVVRRHPGLANVLAEGRLTRAFLRRHLTPATNCVDVGAHLGVLLHQMVTLAPQGRHHAFEPVPAKASWLRRKFPAVSVHQMALSDHSGEGKLFVNPASSALSALRRNGDGSPADVIEVEVRRLDDVLPVETPIGFVKIDAIGAELSVMRGADSILRTHRPIVLFENSHATLARFGLTATDVYDHVVGSLGYDLYSLKGIMAGDPPLDPVRFEAAMVYPFEAFNFVALAPGR